jgi:hypothetical protein
MISASGLLYIANFFYKQALWIQQDINKAHMLLSWLTNRVISLEEIEAWLNQNNEILDSFDILSFTYFQPDNYNHYIVYNEYVSNDLKHTIISLDRKPGNDILLEVNKEGFIKGYKNIPNLYIFIAITSEFKNDPGTKEMAAYKFLDPLFESMGQNKLNSNQLKIEKELFIQTNKSKLDKLISSFASYPKELGEGDDGVAYSISPTLVLKIFKDQFSYIKAKDSYERLHKNPEFGKNEAMIYDIGTLGNFAGQPVYYYIIEKMETLNPTMKKYLAPIVGAIGTYIRKNKDVFKNISKELYDDKNNHKIKSYLDSESNKIKEYIEYNYKDQIENIESAEELNKDWVKNLVEEILFKFITDRADLHLGNLGLTNYGKFIYFDPSHEFWENNADVINTPVRDDIDFMERDNVEPDTFNNLFV